MDILCVGQLAADILVKPIESLEYQVDTKRVETIQVQNGGDAMNTAVSLAKLSNDVGFCGRVGNDSFGDHLLNVFAQYNINTKYLKVNEGGSTCAALCCINSAGERTFFYYGGENEGFCIDDIPDDAVKAAKIVHVGGTYMLPSFDGDGAAALFEKAKALGKKTGMDCTFDVTGKWLETIRPCMPHLDFFLPSLNEAKRMVGSDDPEYIADKFHELGVKTVVVKLGKDGCLVSDGNVKKRLPAMDVPVIDTTGAGDSFVAGFLTGINKGLSAFESAKLASAVSACCIGALGATAGVKDLAATLEVLKSRNRDIWGLDL